MTPETRSMVVVRAPGTSNKPMLRVSNRLLTNAGFNIGTAIEVTYERSIITIRKIK